MNGLDVLISPSMLNSDSVTISLRQAYLCGAANLLGNSDRDADKSLSRTRRPNAINRLA
jgi:hypothetical protein